VESELKVVYSTDASLVGEDFGGLDVVDVSRISSATPATLRVFGHLPKKGKRSGRAAT
jgi:hypothetical protein